MCGDVGGRNVHCQLVHSVDGLEKSLLTLGLRAARQLLEGQRVQYLLGQLLHYYIIVLLRLVEEPVSKSSSKVFIISVYLGKHTM